MQSLHQLSFFMETGETVFSEVICQIPNNPLKKNLVFLARGIKGNMEMSQFGIFLCKQDFQPWGVSCGYEGLPKVATNSPALQKAPFLVVWSLFDEL